MVKYLETRKKHFYKMSKRGKKTLQKKYKRNKTRNPKKMIGGGIIRGITEDVAETEFEQKYAIINYGSAPISTYNLVNCIAIGGVFELDGKLGTFLTHESPTDNLEHQSKLNKIKQILDTKGAKITKIVLFHIDEPATDVYKDGSTTTSIISLMIDFCKKIFDLEPNIHYYTCDISNFRCGKAIISPTTYNSVTTPIVPPDIDRRRDYVETASEKSNLQTFKVTVLTNKDGDKIYQCPTCLTKTGTDAPKFPTNTSLFAHNFDCSNKGKIPVEK